MIDRIQNAQGERLDFTFAGDPDADTVVVFGHGVTANKDRPFLVALGDALTERGVANLRFSFAGNGDSEGRFEDATVTKEVADLGAVLDALGDRRLAYVGHSMGGAVGVLRAAEDSRIQALVSLAGMVHTADFAQRKFGDLTPGKDCMWDKPECPLSQTFMDDMAAIGNVLDQARKVTVPWLLVHGDADTVVPLQDSLDVRSATDRRAAIAELAGADHVFSQPAMTGAMVEAAAPWIAAQMG